MKIFLYDAESDYELQDEEDSLQEALKEFYELSDGEGSFFGIKTDTSTIQFAWEAEDKWLVDVPYDMGNFICLQKYADYDECTALIEEIFSGVIPKDIKGLVKLNIMEDDLDELLARNKEFPGLHVGDKQSEGKEIYDDSRWHIATDFPKDLPKEAALTHMGMFMGWVLDKGFEGDLLKQHFSTNIDKFKKRQITGAKFLELSSDFRLTAKDLNDHANKFVNSYYGSDKYLKDYSNLADHANETVFHEPDTWEKYKIIKTMIDEKYEEWTFRN